MAEPITGVIVEFVGRPDFMRIIDSARETKLEQRKRSQRRRSKPLPEPSQSSPNIDYRSKSWWEEDKRPPEVKSWKSNPKARKIWMRHPHRVKYPPVKLLSKKCIYPHIYNF